MYKIWIDSSDRYNKIVRLTKDGEKIDELSGDIDITDSVAKLLKKNGLKPGDISVYEPKLGPGSFTGLKIGVTAANVLNWALGKKTLNELDLPEYGREPYISERKKPL